MELKKILALILACTMALSLFTACGGGEDDAAYEDDTDSYVEYEDDEYTEDEELSDDEYAEDEYTEDEEPAAGEAVSDELWKEYLVAQYTMGELMGVVAEDTPEDVLAVADEMLDFVDTVSPMTREDYTEELVAENLEKMYYYIGIMSPYADVTEDGTFLRKE